MEQESTPKPKDKPPEPPREPLGPRPERDREQYVHDVVRSEQAAARQKGRRNA